MVELVSLITEVDLERGPYVEISSNGRLWSANTNLKQIPPGHTDVKAA